MNTPTFDLEPVLSVFVDGEPVSHREAVTNRWGKTYDPTGLKAKELAWRSYCALRFRERWNGLPVDDRTPVHTRCVMWFTRPNYHWVGGKPYTPKGLKDRYQGDFNKLKTTAPDVADNLFKPVGDALQDAGVLTKDSRISGHRIMKLWGDTQDEVGMYLCVSKYLEPE